MTKEEAFKKYLHLYVASKAQVLLKQGDDIGMAYISARLIGKTCEQTSIQELYLRPLSSMTDAEALELAQIVNYEVVQATYSEDDHIINYTIDGTKYYYDWDMDELRPEQFTYLLEHGFDVFKLISAGHAKPLA